MSQQLSRLPAAPAPFNFLKKWIAFTLAVAAVGLPVNETSSYFLLLVACLLIFTGDVSARITAWLGAVSIVLCVIVCKSLFSPPRIEEGHNVFLGEHNEALRAELPSEVFEFMQTAFDAEYPRERRCNPETLWCWRTHNLLQRLQGYDRDAVFPSYRPCDPTLKRCIQGYGFPDRTYAFSADAVFDTPRYSRRVTSVNFSDPNWLRLGFMNEGSYNWWSEVSDVRRALRDLPLWMGLERWRILMPWFVMYQFPEAYVGARLCWRGDVLWERKDQPFERLSASDERCRLITPQDVDQRIFGIAIRPGTLAMRLDIPWRVWLAQWSMTALTFLGMAGVIACLVRVDIKKAALPFLFTCAALVVIAFLDVTSIGGLRAFEGGNDGLFYEAAGRTILQFLLAGDFSSALEGTEKVFYYGGPGLRYLRALEKILFGDTVLGYVTLLLLFPTVVFIIARRFLTARWALGFTLVFIATPLGAFFGSTYFLYVKYALQGFGDPAAYFFYLAALPFIVGASSAGPSLRFSPGFFGALLLALATFVRPVVAPAVAILLGGAGLVALWNRQWSRLAGLCIGFLPVLIMPLHNWYFGGMLVLFSANAESVVLHMRPSSYAAALSELLELNFDGTNLRGAFLQLLDFPVGFLGQAHTGGEIGYLLSVPLHAAAFVVVVYVTAWARNFDAWLRLLAGATLAQHAVALFYGGAVRYFFLAWFLTMLVVAVWLEHGGLRFLKGQSGATALSSSGNSHARRRTDSRNAK